MSTAELLTTPNLPIPSLMPIVRPLRAADRPALHELISKDGLFLPGEVQCALELVDAALQSPEGDYRVLVADVAGRIGGYICFGPTPMTDGTWDLYWIASHPDHRGRGLASRLVEAMEDELRQRGAKRVRVETSHTQEYAAAHRFYERHRYPEVARLADFYREGDDLVILMKRL